MKNNMLIVATVVIVVACSARTNHQTRLESGTEAPVYVAATAETAPSTGNAANDPAILITPGASPTGVILGSVGAGGIEVYAPDGELIGTGSARPSTYVDIRYNFLLRGEKVVLVVANDAAASALVAYSWDDVDKKLIEESELIPLGMEAEGLCLYHSPISQKFYAFVPGSGVIQQWELFDLDGRIESRLTRIVPVGVGAGHCAVSDSSRQVFYSQETVGVAMLNAEPESEAEVEYIDFSGRHGRFTGDVKGVALYEYEDGGYIVVSDADVSRLQVYDMASGEYVGALAVGSTEGIDGVQESEGLAAVSVSLGTGLARGAMVLADDDNDPDSANFKIVSWDEVAGALSLPPEPAYDPTTERQTEIATVSPSVETQPVRTFGDAADDPAIWVHPEDPASSIVIGTQKKRGINVYDLSGKLLQSLEVGRINNADVRYGFKLGAESVDLVTGSNRTRRSIDIWKVDPATRTLVDVADGEIPTDIGDPYGLCMYRSATSGEYYVYVNNTDGVVKQWQLIDAHNGKVGANLVREFRVGSQTEGCTADDETGDLYIGEEDVALWKYSAEPDGGEARTMVDNTDTGNLTDDIEGVSIYYGPNGTGYVIASNQGADNYTVYDRQGDNRFLGHFYVVADEETGIDGASETDGLDVTSANLGPAFPNGALVVQDGRNISPVENQNFKIVPWERVAAALGLAISSEYDPRRNP